MKRNIKKKILVIGAGVIGSLYAGKLALAGNDVTLIARGKRLKALSTEGILLKNALTGKQTRASVKAVEKETSGAPFDLIIVAVRYDQVHSVLPVISAFPGKAPVLFMVNNPLGYEKWIDSVGADRLVIGFPGAGGVIEDATVEYTIVSGLLQATTIGEPSGGVSSRVREIARLFRNAGFPTAVSRNMDAWQKTHVAWVTPCAFGIYHARSNGLDLSQHRDSVVLMVKGIREGFAVLREREIKITPAKFRILELAPAFILVSAFRLWAGSRHFDVAAQRHALNAEVEMIALAQGFMTWTQGSQVPTPFLSLLYSIGAENTLERHT